MRYPGSGVVLDCTLPPFLLPLNSFHCGITIRTHGLNTGGSDQIDHVHGLIDMTTHYLIVGSVTHVRQSRADFRVWFSERKKTDVIKS